MPKLFCSEVAHRSGRGFPSRSWPRSAKTVSCVWPFTRGARSPKIADVMGGSDQGCDRLRRPGTRHAVRRHRDNRHLGVGTR